MLSLFYSENFHLVRAPLSTHPTSHKYLLYLFLLLDSMYSAGRVIWEDW